MPLPPLPAPAPPIPGLTTTAADIIRRALMMLNVLDKTSAMDALDAADGLISLNRMIDGWSGNILMRFATDLFEFMLIPGQQVYRLGSGGDFNVPRPPDIERMSVVNIANSALPAEIPIKIWHDPEWQMQPVKLIANTQPYACYDDEAFPFRNLSFFPIPTLAIPVRIYSGQLLSYFPSLTATVSMPPAYLEAMETNLAVRLASLFPPAQPSQSVVAIAALTLSVIESVNTEIGLLTLDSSLGPTTRGRHNIITDRPVRS